MDLQNSEIIQNIFIESNFLFTKDNIKYGVNYFFPDGSKLINYNDDQYPLIPFTFPDNETIKIMKISKRFLKKLKSNTKKKNNEIKKKIDYLKMEKHIDKFKNDILLFEKKNNEIKEYLKKYSILKQKQKQEDNINQIIQNDNDDNFRIFYLQNIDNEINTNNNCLKNKNKKLKKEKIINDLKNIDNELEIYSENFIIKSQNQNLNEKLIQKNNERKDEINFYQTTDKKESFQQDKQNINNNNEILKNEINEKDKIMSVDDNKKINNEEISNDTTNKNMEQ